MNTKPIEEMTKQEYMAWRGKKASLAMAEKAKRGELPGCAPVGYRNVWTGGEKSVVFDEKLAPLVRETFELAAEGTHPLRKILAVMTEKGLVSRTGGNLSVSSLWGILTNPFYIGMMRYGDEVVAGRHERSVSDETFERVNRNLMSRRRNDREIIQSKKPLLEERP